MNAASAFDAERFEADLAAYNVSAATCAELGCAYSSEREFFMEAD